MAGSGTDTVTETDPAQVMYCARHPNVETLIRCSRCLTPICPKCAIRTPVGLRCPDCGRIGRSPLYSLAPHHYVLAAIVSLVLSLIAGVLIRQSYLWITLFISAPVGGFIAEVTTRSVRGKRGRAIQIITCASIALGAAAPSLALLFLTGLTGVGADLASILGALLDLNAILYAVMAIGMAWYRLR